ncbi:hypothetical protein FJ251_00190 [bacterium]|nr:hypothetical protein [bacterium]
MTTDTAPRRAQRALFLALPPLLLALAALLGKPAAAQELGVLSTEAGLPVRLEGARPLNALTPFTMNAAGAYTRLRAGGRGFESRQARLGWDAQGHPLVTNDATRRAVLGTLLPGGGSLLSNRRLHGTVELATAAYLAIGIVQASDDRDAALEDYERWRALAEDANDPTAYERQAGIALGLWSEQKRHRERQLLTTGVYLGLGVLESWWFNRPLEAQIRGQQLGLQVPRLSRGKAVLASLILPGMGQAYRHQWRSGVYLAAGAYLAQESLDSYRRRELHERVLVEERGFLSADGLDAGEAERLRRLQERMQQAKDDLHLLGALAGGLWVVNAMDALLSHPEGSRPRGRVPKLALLASPAGQPGLGVSTAF